MGVGAPLVVVAIGSGAINSFLGVSCIENRIDSLH